MANPGLLALDALNRILTGTTGDKMEEEEGQQEEEIHDTDCHTDEKSDSFEENDSAKEDLSNPLIYKNAMLRQSGSIYFLARAIVEAFEAVSCIIIGEKNEEVEGRKSATGSKGQNTDCCLGCLSYLRYKVNCLSSIIDGACCLSDENRRLFCVVGYTSDHSSSIEEAILVPSLINCICQVVYKTSDNLIPQYHELFSDIGLAAFRTLTSLTHNNELAGLQLMAMYEVKVNVSEIKQRQSGVAIVFRVLCHLVQIRHEIQSRGLGDKCNSSEKSLLSNNYDATIFCFNILTNILETSTSHDARSVISKLQIEITDSEELALRWLARWVVGLTESYRNALMMGSFGDKNAKGTEITNDLKHHDDEYLVMAGNGFIFFACLMRQGDTCAVADSGNKVGLSSHVEELTLDLRNVILSEMPPDQNGNGTRATLMIKSLKAFCNYYRYTIGELSVAIVPSVMRLISELETIKS